ncbi:response regulator, partial [Candidatus Pacearchaeota archaeon]|nr:response regulator [Candidatus Pacearchaeota archaeon]
SDPLETYKNLEQNLIEDHFKEDDITILKIEADEMEEQIAANIFPDILILDTLQPFVKGTYIIRSIKEKNPNTKIIVVSGDSTDLPEITKFNIPCIVKPFVASTFIAIFTNIYSSYNISG